MKLHLPKTLLVAVLAACVGMGQAQAMSVTYDYTDGQLVEFTTGKPVDGAEAVYQGLAIAWNNGTLKNVDFSKEVSFDLTLGWSSAAPLITTSGGNSKWGYRTTADGNIEEQWGDGEWNDGNRTDDDNTITGTQLSTLDTDKNNSVKLTVLINGTGTYMKTPGADSWDLDSSPNLKIADATLSQMNINKGLITKVYAYDAGSATFTAGEWENTYKKGEVVNATVNRIEVRGLADGSTKTVDGVEVGTDKDIVVGATGQLFLQTWHSAGNINVESDIILGGSSHSDFNNYGAIRFGNDKGSYSTNLSGAITLVEDSKIISHSTDTISISGGITGDHALTVGGAGYQFSGKKIEISSLKLGKGRTSGGADVNGGMSFANEVEVDSLSIDASTVATFNNKLTIGSTIVNNGTLTLNGQLAIDSLEGLSKEYYSTGGDTNGISTYGYLYHLVNGTGTLNGTQTQISYGDTTYNIADGIKIEEGSAYVVATGTVQVGGDSAAADTKSATQFLVKQNATLLLNDREDDAALTAGQVIATALGNGTIDLCTIATINKENTETATVFQGDIKVSTGGKLQLCDDRFPDTGPGDTNGYTIDLSSLSGIELAGGELRYRGASSSLGNIKVSADSTLYVFDVASESDTVTIEKLNLASSAKMNLTSRWKSSTNIKVLTGDGTLDVSAPRESGAPKLVTIESTSDFTGKINQTGGTIKATRGLTIGEVTKTGGTLQLTAGTTSINKGMKVDTVDVTGLEMLVLGTREGNSTTEEYSIGQLTGTTELEVNEGTLELGAHNNSVSLLDLSANDKSDAAVKVKEGGILNVTNSLWMSNRATNKICLEEGAQLNATYANVGSKHSVSIKGKKAGATITNSANSEYALAKATYTISNAEVTIADNGSGDNVQEVQLSNILDNSSLTNSSTKTLITTNGHSNITAINAENGDINLTWFAQQGKQGTVTNLTIGEGRTVGVYTGATGSAEKDITVSSLTAGSGATLNANLILTNRASLTLDGALAMGSTLTLGESMTLNGDLLSEIQGLSEGGTKDLFTGVDALYLGSSTTASGNLTETDGVALSTYFTGFDDTYYLGYDGQKVFAGKVIPEPTTATLSLLALAALAARRRRK